MNDRNLPDDLPWLPNGPIARPVTWTRHAIDEPGDTAAAAVERLPAGAGAA